MNEYQEKIEEYKEYLSLLSNQIIIDLKGILLDEIIEYEFGKKNSDIVIYLFEYGHELFDLTFYGFDKKFGFYTKLISLPTKFPDENHNCLTSKKNVLFEQEKFINWCEKKISPDEYEEFEKYLKEKRELFKNWFFSCWKTAKKGIDCKKGFYFSIHDTDERIDLLTMKTIRDKEIMKKFDSE